MCQIALLIALTIILNRFLSIETPIVRIGFAFAPIVIAACAFGPVWAAATYVVADLLGALIKAQTPIPGLTLSYALMGFIFGLFLYGRAGFKPSSVKSWLRVVIPVAINQVVLSLLVNSFWLAAAGYYSGYLATVGVRVAQTAILIPVQAAVTPLLLRVVAILEKQRFIARA
jgi:ECF transporter S component (folate family)